MNKQSNFVSSLDKFVRGEVSFSFYSYKREASQNALCLKENPHDEFMTKRRMSSFTDGWIDYKVVVGEHIYN